MKYDHKYSHDILKDLIVEEDADIKREDIVIEDVWMNLKMTNIMIEFTTKDMKKEFGQSTIHTCILEEYSLRAKENSRDDKLNDLGI